MSTSTQRLAVPDDIESPAGKLVYVAILLTEEATVADLQQLLDLSKLTLLPILSSLVDDGFVQRTEGRYASR